VVSGWSPNSLPCCHCQLPPCRAHTPIRFSCRSLLFRLRSKRCYTKFKKICLKEENTPSAVRWWWKGFRSTNKLHASTQGYYSLLLEETAFSNPKRQEGSTHAECAVAISCDGNLLKFSCDGNQLPLCSTRAPYNYHSSSGQVVFSKRLYFGLKGREQNELLFFLKQEIPRAQKRKACSSGNRRRD